MSIELKIKAKHLASEAKIIKIEEIKLKQRIKMKPLDMDSAIRELNNISSHRKGIVRSVARSTNLARGFLKGMRYRRMEDKRTKNYPAWHEVERMAVKYSNEDQRIVKQKFHEWKSEA